MEALKCAFHKEPIRRDNEIVLSQIDLVGRNAVARRQSSAKEIQFHLEEEA